MLKEFVFLSEKDTSFNISRWLKMKVEDDFSYFMLDSGIQRIQKCFKYENMVDPTLQNRDPD